MRGEVLRLLKYYQQEIVTEDLQARAHKLDRLLCERKQSLDTRPTKPLELQWLESQSPLQRISIMDGLEPNKA